MFDDRELLLASNRQRLGLTAKEAPLGHPGAPDARITKMKNGRMHLAHKDEHAVDMGTGALVGVTVQTMDGGNTASQEDSLNAATEVVADKGYHSNKVMVLLEARGVRSYISEPKRGRRNWKKNKEAQKPTKANRRRIQSSRGKSLLCHRCEKVEHAFSHLLEMGGLRRAHVRDNLEILKRAILQGAAFYLGLLMRACCGVVSQESSMGLGPSNWHWQGPSRPLIKMQPSMN